MSFSRQLDSQKGEEKQWRMSIQYHDDSTAHEQAEEWRKLLEKPNRSFHRLADPLCGSKLSSSQRLNFESGDGSQKLHTDKREIF